jgi:hypothetical protein
MGISRLNVHPDRDMLANYSAEVRLGTWIGTLQDLAWGKSHNLFCYFTDEEDGARYRLSVFWNRQYRPHGEGPAFDKEPVGTVYEITAETSKNGLPKFMTAREIEE